MKQSAMKLINFYAPHSLDNMLVEESTLEMTSKADKIRNILMQYFEDKPKYALKMEALKKEIAN